MNHLAIFAKFWEAGKVKTRLAKSIGDEKARDVYFLFLHYLVSKFDGFGDVRTVIFTPVDRRDEFRNSISKSWELSPQSDGDLGVRMKSFFESFDRGADHKNILIGSDTPDLPVEYLQQTVDALDRVPFVLGPSGDGGYYLIACRGAAPEVFNGIEWSTETVFRRTIEKLESQGVPFELLPQLKDVDEMEDLQRLISDLRKSEIDKRLLEELQRIGMADE